MADCQKHYACVCRGTGTIEEGPAGATWSVPCPGPPEQIVQHGVVYVPQYHEWRAIDRIRELEAQLADAQGNPA